MPPAEQRPVHAQRGVVHAGRRGRRHAGAAGGQHADPDPRLGHRRSRPSPAPSFAAQQLFLAETAMIAAEAPHLSRAIVVAPAASAGTRRPAWPAGCWPTPPARRGWPRSARAAWPPTQGHRARCPGRPRIASGPAWPARSLLRGVAAADRGATLIQSMRVRSSPAAEPGHRRRRVGSAWRGSAGSQQQARACWAGCRTTSPPRSAGCPSSSPAGTRSAARPGRFPSRSTTSCPTPSRSGSSSASARTRAAGSPC